MSIDRYDDLYRLAYEHRTANGGDPGVAYEYNFAYDDAGNRMEWDVAGQQPIFYHYDAANEMTDYGTSNVSPYTGNTIVQHDVKGNMLAESNGTSYTWDIQNRLTQWTKTSQTTETYIYNADGIRVRKTPNGGTQTDFLLDFTEIAEEITGSSDISYVGPELISRIEGTTRTVYHADGIGSTRAMSDSNEAVVQAEVYDAYGNRLTTSVPAPTFGFAGQYRYYADATGLDYLKARYYEPGVGRFISQDPIGYEGGLNLYSYVDNRPLAFVDPTGQKPSPYDLLWLEACIEGCVKAILGDFPGYDNPKAIKNQIRPWCALLCARFKACGCNGLSKYCLSIPNTNHGKWCMTFYISVCPNG